MEGALGREREGGARRFAIGEFHMIPPTGGRMHLVPGWVVWKAKKRWECGNVGVYIHSPVV